MTQNKDELSAEWTAELERVLYEEDVEKAIQEVCPSTDPLDSNDFNPTEYINKLFPTEQSLSNIDESITRIRTKVQQLDEEIRGVVRGQADAGHDGRQALEEAQQTIQELFKKIRDIKEKAEHSEDMVRKITGDIKQLDNAKKHLTDSVRTLERLRFLMTALTELQENVHARNYAAVSTRLRGATGVMEEFSRYQSIPQVKQLLDRLSSIESDLGQQIKSDFESAFSTKGMNPDSKAQLHDACLVLDTLEVPKREELIQWFLRLRLSDYDDAFQDSNGQAWLDKVDRRYSWFKRALITYEEECQDIFPEEWGISERFAMDFCAMTRKNLSEQMSSRASDLDVALLLFAIQKTSAFEKQLATKYYASSYMKKLMPPTPSAVMEEAEVDGENPEDEEQLTKKKSTFKQDSPFLGMISRCFENHLGVYINSQDKALSELMETFVSDLKSKVPTTVAEETSIELPSAADLFVFYKKCLQQCVSLSTGPPLMQLTELFQKYLREYSQRVLMAVLPKGSASSASVRLSLRKDPQETRLTSEELVATCSVICTADYCLETTQQMEAKLKEKIEPTLTEKVNFSQEMEGLHGIISSAIQLLVQDMEGGCSAALNTMVKIPWQTIEAVGDQSPYVTAIAAHIRTTVPVLRDGLSSTRKYFVNFCTKFANSFIPSYITSLYKCKPISTIAVEQLLLDTHSLKSYLLDLPSVGASVAKKAPGPYVKVVTKGMEKAEMILKTLMASHEHAEDFVASYIKFMSPDNDIGNFQKVLEMKGMKRNEQSALIELFKTKVSVTDNSAPPTLEKNRPATTMKKLEKLMRFTT